MIAKKYRIARRTVCVVWCFTFGYVLSTLVGLDLIRAQPPPDASYETSPLHSTQPKLPTKYAFSLLDYLQKACKKASQKSSLFSLSSQEPSFYYSLRFVCQKNPLLKPQVPHQNFSPEERAPPHMF